MSKEDLVLDDKKFKEIVLGVTANYPESVSIECAEKIDLFLENHGGLNVKQWRMALCEKVKLFVDSQEEETQEFIKKIGPLVEIRIREYFSPSHLVNFKAFTENTRRDWNTTDLKQWEKGPVKGSTICSFISKVPGRAGFLKKVRFLWPNEADSLLKNFKIKKIEQAGLIGTYYVDDDFIINLEEDFGRQFVPIERQLLEAFIDDAKEGAITDLLFAKQSGHEAAWEIYLES